MQGEPLPSLASIPDDLESPMDAVRCIRYDFGAEFLDKKSIGTRYFGIMWGVVFNVADSLTFSVGDREISNFRMIERHYFRNRLIKSFDFNLGFCMPNSRNTWEVMYSVPELDASLSKTRRLSMISMLQSGK